MSDRPRQPKPKHRYCAYCGIRLPSGRTEPTCCTRCDIHIRRKAKEKVQ